MSLDQLDSLYTGARESTSTPNPFDVVKWSIKDETTLTHTPQIGKEVIGTMLYMREEQKWKDGVAQTWKNSRGEELPSLDTCLHFLLDDGSIVRMFVTGQLWTAFAEANVAAGFGTRAGTKLRPKWPIRRYKVRLEKVVPMNEGKAYQYSVAGPAEPKPEQVPAIVAANKQVADFYAAKALGAVPGAALASSAPSDDDC